MVKYVYTLGASGERIKVEELDRTVEYTYDSLYRLTSETIIKGKTKTTYTYAYDSVSNRTLKTVNGVETVYTYNELNQLVSEDGTTYEYDNAGNLVRVVGAGKTALYVYNADNKLVKATVQQGNNVVVETYTYDYAGNRTSKTTSINNHVEKVYYLNDNSSLTNVLVEFGANGDEICYYTIGADLLSQEIDGEVYVYLYDGHGTVRALANSKGKVTDTYTYDAFGNLISSNGSTANNYRYCGEQFDSTTGLYYLRARYMDTNTGRFTSQDTYAGSTADPTSLHKYLYANSNPVMYSDPSGYFSLASVVCASTIGDMLFYSVSSGMIAFGMKLIRELRNVNAGLQVAVNWSEVIEETVIAMLMGGFFFCAGALAISLSSAAIFLALGGSCLIFFAMNCAAAQADWESGNYDLAILEMIFAAGSVIGAKNCFDNAGAIVSASATASSITDPSPSNKQTASGNDGNNPNNTSYERPSGYRKGVREQVWENAKNLDGEVLDPITRQKMNYDEPWDMGHKPGYEFRKHQQSARERGITRKQFLDEHNNPDHYRPELPSSNRSHTGEDMTDHYLGP